MLDSSSTVTPAILSAWRGQLAATGKRLGLRHLLTLASSRITAALCDSVPAVTRPYHGKCVKLFSVAGGSH